MSTPVPPPASLPCYALPCFFISSKQKAAAKQAAREAKRAAKEAKRLAREAEDKRLQEVRGYH